MKKNNNLAKNIGVFTLCTILTAGLIFGIKFLKDTKLAITGTDTPQTFIQPTENEAQTQAQTQTPTRPAQIPAKVWKSMPIEQKNAQQDFSNNYNSVKGDVDSRAEQIKANVEYQKSINPVRRQEQIQQDIETAPSK